MVLRYLYTIILYLGMPFILLRLLWKSKKQPGYRKNILQRFGFCPFHLKQSLWIHAVSLGETIAATPLIKKLQLQYPHLPIVVTNMTATGAARVQAIFGVTVYQTFIPYDLPGMIQRFLNRCNPAIAIIMETELWPNIFLLCKKNNIPIIIVNARLSERSFKRYKKISSLTKSMLQTIHTLAAQTQTEAMRFIDLGLAKERSQVTGSIKFDLEVPNDLVEKSLILRKQLGQQRPIWIAASTHYGEDEKILSAHKQILLQFPNALLMLAPRHPERFLSVSTLIKNNNFKTVKRSQNLIDNSFAQVYLCDTVGELLLLMQVSDLVFIAGSLNPTGGHNVLEPAALGKPILIGPHYFNFLEITQSMQTANALQIVQDEMDLARQVLYLFENQGIRLNLGANAKQFIEPRRGALAKQFFIINSILGKRRKELTS